MASRFFGRATNEIEIRQINFNYEHVQEHQKNCGMQQESDDGNLYDILSYRKEWGLGTLGCDGDKLRGGRLSSCK